MSDAKGAPDPKWVGGLIGAVVLALGGGMGGGYALRGSATQAGTNQDSRTVDPSRVAVLEALAARAQKDSEQERADRAQEREQWTSALKDSTATNAALRMAVVALTERFGSMTERQDELDNRVKALETRRR